MAFILLGWLFWAEHHSGVESDSACGSAKSRLFLSSLNTRQDFIDEMIHVNVSYSYTRKKVALRTIEVSFSIQ